MKTIYKTELDEATNYVELPANSSPLCLQLQKEIPCIWWQVPDTEAVTKRFDVFVIGTGYILPARAITYVGTFQVEEGRFVFHVYIGEQK